MGMARLCTLVAGTQKSIEDAPAPGILAQAPPHGGKSTHAGPGNWGGRGENDARPLTSVKRATQTGSLEGQSASDAHCWHARPPASAAHTRDPSAFSTHHALYIRPLRCQHR